MGLEAWGRSAALVLLVYGWVFGFYNYYLLRGELQRTQLQMKSLEVLHEAEVSARHNIGWGPESARTLSVVMNRAPIVFGVIDADPPYILSFPIENAQMDYYLAILLKTRDRIAIPGSYVIDVGATLGLTALPIAAAGYNVICFEPIQYNVRKLRESIMLNNFGHRVTVVEKALSDAIPPDGLVTMYHADRKEDNAALTPACSVLNVGGVPQPVKVPVDTIDNWLAAHPEVDPKAIRLLKVNAMGHERRVLQGAKNFLNEHHSNVDIRLTFSPRLLLAAGTSPKDLLVMLADMGYSIMSDHGPIFAVMFDSYIRRVTFAETLQLTVAQT